MDINKLRKKRNELEQAIENLISTFVQETNVEVAEVKFQPAVFGPAPQYQEVTPVEINVELVI
jgi:hypothetical protein